MAYVTHLFFPRLPGPFDTLRLRDVLCARFREEESLHDADPNNAMTLAPYFGSPDDGHSEWSVVLSGVAVNLARMKRQGLYVDLAAPATGRVRFQADRGDVRKYDGTYSSRCNEIERHEDSFLWGGYQQRLEVFTTAFSTLYSQFIDDRRPCIRLNNSDFIPTCMEDEIGPIDLFEVDDNRTTLHFRGRLLTAHMATLIHGRSFRTGSRSEKAKILCDKGRVSLPDKALSHFTVERQINMIGYDQDPHYGYIPMDELKHLPIIDYHKLVRSTTPVCWHCEQPYRILGLDIDLVYTAAKCGCDYSHTSNEEAEAHCWEGEKFTRLVAFGDDGSKFNLMVQYLPLRPKYASAKEYRRIVKPLLDDDFKNRMAVHRENTVDGRVTSVKLMTDLDEGAQNSYRIELCVPKRGLWQIPNPMNVENLHITLTEANSEGKMVPVQPLEKWRGRLDDIVADTSDDFLIIHAQVRLPTQVADTATHLLIEPLLSCRQYTYHRDLLDDLAANGSKSKLVDSVIFGQEDEGEFYRNMTKDDVKFFNHESHENRLARNYDKHSGLDEKQWLACKNYALTSKVSIIAGLHGSGKTFCASVIIATVASQDHTVLALAPSIETVMVLASALAERNRSIGNPHMKIIQMVANGIEQRMYNKLVGDGGGGVTGLTTLHDEVGRHPKYLSGEEFVEIRSAIHKGRVHLLDPRQIAKLVKHISHVERRVLCEYNVILCTASSLYDKRLERWIVSGRGRPIGTLVIDEANTIPQIDLINPLRFNPARTILIGDQQQLCTSMHSKSAMIAGLARSAVYWMDRRQRENIFKTILEKNYRMHSDINYLVSEFIDTKKAINAGNVLDRQCEAALSQMMKSAVPRLHKRVIVRYHRYAELSAKLGEAKEATSTARAMLRYGVNEKDVIMITMTESQGTLVAGMLRGTGIAVHSAKSFQGRETKYAIVCTTGGETDASYDGLGFTGMRNRLNVALSRASEFVIIYMDKLDFSSADSKSAGLLLELCEKYAQIIFKPIKF